MEEQIKKLNNYTPSGQVVLLLSVFLVAIGIVISFFTTYRVFLCSLYMTAAMDYLNMQYLTTKEYWDRVLGPRMYKPSRDMFALFFVATALSLCILTLNLASLDISMPLLSLSLAGASVACVFNEYGINGPKKELGLVACVFALIGIILLNLLVFGII